MSAPVVARGSWRIGSEPARLWPVLSDLSALYQTMEKQEGFGAPDGDSEMPLEWVEGVRWVHRRRFVSGSVRSATLSLHLVPEENGTRVDCMVSCEMRGLLGRLFAGRSSVRRALRAMGVLVGKIALWANAAEEDWIAWEGNGLANPRAQALADRLEARARRIARSGLSHGAEEALARAVRRAPAHLIDELRPARFAPVLGLTRLKTTELFLAACEAGVLRLRHQVLCPECRAVSARAAHISAIQPQILCAACGLSFAVHLERNVESVFLPLGDSPKGGNRGRPLPSVPPRAHIRLRICVGAGEKLRTPIALQPGAPYRVRLDGGESSADVAPGDGEGIQIHIHRDGRVSGDICPGPGTGATLFNRSDKRAIVTLECQTWRADALVCADLLRMHAFNLLAPREADTPRARLPAGSAAFLFLRIGGLEALYGHLSEQEAARRLSKFAASLGDLARAGGGALLQATHGRFLLVFRTGALALWVGEAAERAIEPSFGTGGARARLSLSGGMAEGEAFVICRNGAISFVGEAATRAITRAQSACAGEIRREDPPAPSHMPPAPLPGVEGEGSADPFLQPPAAAAGGFGDRPASQGGAS